MARGKYSPAYSGKGPYIYNCYGQEPAPVVEGEEYDMKTMFGDYDRYGFDSYGYSAFDAEGNYVYGGGIDPVGITEETYHSMTDDEYEYWCAFSLKSVEECLAWRKAKEGVLRVKALAGVNCSVADVEAIMGVVLKLKEEGKL